MKEKHSFFLPDFEHLSDPEGMAEYMLSKIIDGRCLYCRTDSCFDSPQAAQQHMIAKAHCRIRYEDEEDAAEYEEFYDFTDEPAPVGGVDFEEYEGCAIVATPGGDAVITDGDDLLLPSGKRLISRKWMRYYTQYYRVPDERVTKQLERLALDYHQAGVMDPSSTATTARKAALSSGTRGKVADVRAQRRDERYQKHFALQTGMQHNMIIRKYFRIQLLQ
jgi:pre-60S factor REI1